jgi:hypothetical protein
MTIDSLNKRLSRLSDAASPTAGIAVSLELARSRHQARQAEWQAAGNTGPVPDEPLEPPPAETARRLDRETWRQIAEAHARVVLLGRDDGVSLAELQALYAMSDPDLMQALNRHAWSASTAREGTQ